MLKKSDCMQKKNKVVIGLVQMPDSDDIQSNMKKAGELVKIAAKQGAQIVCLQELYRSRYFAQYDKKDFSRYAETIPGESTRMFSDIAKECGIVIIVPVFEKARDGQLYNSAAVINDDGRLLETYRKIHIPYDEFYYEKSYFKEGNLGFRVYKTRYAIFAVLICYDQWFPEAARICALKGADIIFYPTAIGLIKENDQPNGDWQNAWETIQRSHAIANGIHIAAVNRVGVEDNLEFWGGSFVCDSFGNIIKKAGKKEEILTAQLDLSENKITQEYWGFFQNRRPDTYEIISDKQKK